jgi:hypothetical protein
VSDQIMDEENGYPDAACVRCGCTDDRACDVGCTWASLEPPICSACVKEGEVLENPLPQPTREEMMAQLFQLGAACEEAAHKLHEMDAQLQAAVNLLVILVQRQGGSVRIQKSELVVIDSNLRLDSYTDAASDTHILEVNKINPETGKPMSSIIVPGRLPLILP